MYNVNASIWDRCKLEFQRGTPFRSCFCQTEGHSESKVFVSVFFYNCASIPEIKEDKSYCNSAS